MATICLQVTQELSEEEILKKINHKKIFKTQPPLELKEKTKIFLGGQRIKMLRQYMRQELVYTKVAGLAIWLEVGVAIVEDNVITQRDLYLTYPQGKEAVVKKLAAYLLTVLPLVLVEPDLEARVQQNRGVYYPQDTLSYQGGTMGGALWAHFGWLIYVVNSAWNKCLDNPEDKRLLRQLRVRLRWLRALLSFYRPVFKERGASYWQRRLRDSGSELGRLRELDVLLLSLENLQKASGKATPRLAGFFGKNRQHKLLAMEKTASLGAKTMELVHLVLWLKGQSLLPQQAQEDFTKITGQRLKKWSKKLLDLTEQPDIFRNMERAHATRIRIKKMRYVLLSLTEFGEHNNALIRQLKKLQDLLGVMHDDYVNGILVSKLKSENKAHQEEILLFSGWETAKVEGTKALLHDVWQEMGREIKHWRKSLD